jgi:hypothetical protein
MGPRIIMGLYPNCVSFIHVVVDPTLNIGVDNVEERHLVVFSTPKGGYGKWV